MIYDINVWGHCESSNKIFLLQKKVIQIINNKPYRSHTNALFNQHRILKFSDTYKLQVALFVYDYFHDNLPSSFHEFFMGNTNQTGRNFYNLFRFRPRTKFSSKLPGHKFPEIWNSLSNLSKASTSKRMFKNVIKNQLLLEYTD